MEVAMAPCSEVLHLRRAHQGDARGIARVHVETWRAAYSDLIPNAYLDALSVDQREEWWAKELNLLPADRHPWVAETREGIVGFAVVGAARDEDAAVSVGEVYAIYVLPECWERGVGRTLLSHAERDLIEHGYAEAVLWVLADNARARSFYELLGWRLDGATKPASFAGREVEEVRYRVALEKSRVAELV
jgi:ribosomal protein S18 acetylase RimI-like enzyme